VGGVLYGCATLRIDAGDEPAACVPVLQQGGTSPFTRCQQQGGAKGPHAPQMAIIDSYIIIIYDMTRIVL